MSVIRQVIPHPEADLYRLLASLQHKEFLYEQPAFPESEYIFKHALTQEVAYGTVLQEQRKLLHERTGQALEALYAATLSEHYSDLAYHYRRSPNTQKAIEYLQLAGQQAVQRSAHAEAISYFSLALELLRSVPATSDREQRELTLQIALGVPLVLTKGHSAPEVEAAYIRARDLCKRSGESPQLFSILLGLGRFYFARGELRTSRELREQLLVLAQRLQDPGLIARAHSMLGETLYYLGEFTQNLTHIGQATALYDPQQHGSHILLYGNDTGVGARLNMARVLWMLGYPDQTLKKLNESITLAQGLAYPFNMAMTLHFASWCRLLRREVRLTQEQGEATIVLSTEHGFALFSGAGMIHAGWALAEQGQVEEGIAQIQQGLVILQAIGAEVFRPYGLTLLAESFGKAGRPEEGLTAVAEALQLVEKNDERFYEAELYRIKGELLLAQAGKLRD
jgi:predicted ATPase